MPFKNNCIRIYNLFLQDNGNVQHSTAIVPVSNNFTGQPFSNLGYHKIAMALLDHGLVRALHDLERGLK